MEERITFLSDGLEIEGLLQKSESDRAAVITHPHPVYGGDMHNPVVGAIAGVYQDMGYTTLRFNFRGTGGSRGRHDKGIGERKDVLAAMDYLKAGGARRVDLAGYSFGAWVNAHLSCQSAAITRMVMVSPPIAFIEFADVDAIECLELVVTGSQDDIAPMGPVQNALSGWNPQARLEIIKGADHFYSGYMPELSAVLRENL
jgi:alpha/beta superfamily hydrolase